MNLTFDTNCIVDLEQKNGNAFPALEILRNLHNEGKVNIAVVAISASERVQGGTYASSFVDFKKKLAAAGLERVNILQPICYWDITFFDWCLYADEQMVELERKIHEILFPEISFNYADFCKRVKLDSNGDTTDPKWRNTKCDVLGMWSHINEGREIFVTSDRNFRKQTKKPRLIALGAGNISTPQDTVLLLENI